MSENHKFLEGLEENGKKYLNNLISKEKLDKTRFLDRIQSEFNKVENVRDPIAFLKFTINKIVLADYKEVPLSINRIEFDYDAWKKKWDDKGFSGDDIDYVLIIRIYEHMVNEFPVTLDEIRELDRKVTDYCVENNLVTYSDILNSILRTKTFKKCNVPVDTLRKDASETVDLMNFFKNRESESEEFDPTFSIAEIEQVNKLEIDESEPSI